MPKSRHQYRLPVGYRRVVETRTGLLLDGKFREGRWPGLNRWNRVPRVRVDKLTCGHKKVSMSTFGWPKQRAYRKCDKCTERLAKAPLPIERLILKRRNLS